MIFFRQIQHLLPRARAWRLTTEKNLRSIFIALSTIGDAVKLFADLILLDIFAQTTRRIDEWEGQFNLPDVGMSEQERRDRLGSEFKALGGQSPRYIQDTLQNAGFPVYVHEWWWPYEGTVLTLSGGGELNGDYDISSLKINYKYSFTKSNFLGILEANIYWDGSRFVAESFFDAGVVKYYNEDDTDIPTTTGWVLGDGAAPVPAFAYNVNPLSAREPLDYLRRNASAIGFYGCGESFMQCGEAQAQCGEGTTLQGYALVNKIYESQVNWLSLCGESFIQCGEAQAVCGDYLEYTEQLKDYTVPSDPDTWPYFLYLGGEVFGDLATIDSKRRNEFETLCLKICPAQQWLGMLVNYS